ncbi:MAG: VanZ family protein [Clostridia bacterium]|nr:VanZ family protein [Clostridia bacterium]
MSKKLFIKVVYILYLVGIIAFIFSNSLPSIEESAESSGRLLGFINGILEACKLPIMTSDVFIRKAAHFAEFFVLGASVCGYSVFDKKLDVNYAIKSVLFSCLIAMSDETIQYFTGRGSMLLDAWLDLFGAVTGIVICYFILKKKLKKTWYLN